MAHVHHLVPQIPRRLTWIIRSRNAPRDRQEHPQSIRAQARAEGRFQIAALCAHAGGEEPQIGRGLTYPFERVYLRRADNQPNIPFLVPCLGEVGDIFVERYWRLEIAP